MSTTRAFEELADKASGGEQRRAARRQAVLQLSNLMPGSDVRPEDVRMVRNRSDVVTTPTPTEEQSSLDRGEGVMELAGLMQRPTNEPEKEEDSDLQVMKAAIELWNRIGREAFNALAMSVKEDTPSQMEFSRKTGAERDEAVMSLASLVQQQLDQGR